MTVTVADDDDSAFTANGIETISIRATGAAAGDVDLEFGDVSGVQTIEFRRTNEDVSLINVQSLATTLKLNNVANADALQVDYDAAVVAGTSDAVAVAVDTSIGGATLTVNGVETLNVTATGADNDVDFAGNALEAINIAGAGDLTTSVSGAIAVNAASNTGGATVDVTAGAGITSLTGGTGDDTFSFVGGAYLGGATTADVVDGGAGNDTLSITAFTTTAGETYSATGIETLELTSANGTNVDFDLFSQDFTTVHLHVAGAHAQTLTDVENAASVVVTNGTAGTDATLTALNLTRVSDTSTADSTTVTLDADGNDTGDDLTISTLNIDEIETVNLVLNATSDGSIAVAEITANEIGTLNISGAADATIGGTTALTIETIDASTATGNLTLELGASAQTVTGGTGDDTFDFNGNLATTDSVVGGAGDDTLVAAMAAGTAAAKITGVETASLEFGTASATFSGANASTDLTSVSIAAASDEAVSLTALKSAVATVRLGATVGAAAGDAATIAYASGSNAAHTVVIGDSTATPAGDVDTGAVTISGNAGALTISSDAFTGNSVYAITANTATSVAINTEENLEVDDSATGTGALAFTAATSFTATSAGGVLLVDGTTDVSNATAITINGADGNITFTGAMTATDMTSLTVTAAAGVTVTQTGNIESDADVTTVAMTATGASSSISYAGVLDVEHVRTINLTAATGGSVTVADIEMLGVDNDGATDIDTVINISATGVDASDNGSTVTVSAINTAAATLDSVVITSDADGTVSFTTGAASLTITAINASASAGDLTIDASTLAAATSITTGSGANSITTDNGFADTITLASAAGDDTINVTNDNAGASAADVITNFVVGTDGDVLSLTVANLDGTGVDPVNGVGTDLSTALAVNIQTDADGALTLAAATNIIRLTDTFADVAAVVTAMAGNVATAGVSSIADNDNLLVIWTNGASAFVSRLQVNDATFNASAGSDTIAGFDQAENLVELVGVTVSDITAANFAFV